MARKWSNLNIPGALHFVTGNVRDRIPMFKEESCAKEFFKVSGSKLPFLTLRLLNRLNPHAESADQS